MTNKEYFEKNGISFADAIKKYDIAKYGTFEQFLYAKHEHKYNVGDVLVWMFNGCSYVIYDIYGGKYYCVSHTVSDTLENVKFKVDGVDDGIYCSLVDDEQKFIKIGHSDLQFAVKKGLIEDEDISRKASEEYD